MVHGTLALPRARQPFDNVQHHASTNCSQHEEARAGCSFSQEDQRQNEKLLWFLAKIRPCRKKTARQKIVIEIVLFLESVWLVSPYGLFIRPIIYYLNLVNAKKTIVVSYFVVDLLAKLSHLLASSC